MGEGLRVEGAIVSQSCGKQTQRKKGRNEDGGGSAAPRPTDARAAMGFHSGARLVGVRPRVHSPGNVFFTRSYSELSFVFYHRTKLVEGGDSAPLVMRHLSGTALQGQETGASHPANHVGAQIPAGCYAKEGFVLVCFWFCFSQFCLSIIQ